MAATFGRSMSRKSSSIHAPRRKPRERAERLRRVVDEIERRTRHDVVAFTEAVAEKIGPASRYIHLGLTSSDILDTCLACQMRQAADLLLEDVAALETVLTELAVKHKRTAMMGRTHGIHAEPTTFGLKLAMWLMEVRRARERLTRARISDPCRDRLGCDRVDLGAGQVGIGVAGAARFEPDHLRTV